MSVARNGPFFRVECGKKRKIARYTKKMKFVRFLCLVHFAICPGLSLAAKTVVVIDMPVEKQKLPEGIRDKVEEVYNMSRPLPLGEDCGELAKELELFFQYALAGKPEKAAGLKHLPRLESFSYKVHGYHVLETVLRNAPAGVKAYHIGVPGPFDGKSVADANKYLKSELPKEFSFITKRLKKIKPDIVNVSGSETVEENAQGLIKAGVSKEQALVFATKIFKAWNGFWLETAKEFSDAVFVVSAGNGGKDWKGDELTREESSLAQTTPAIIGLPNILVVGSQAGGRRSSFSNFGDVVDVFENGEKSRAFIPCQDRSYLELTGTSQATGLHTGKLLKTSRRGLDN